MLCTAHSVHCAQCAVSLPQVCQCVQCTVHCVQVIARKPVDYTSPVAVQVHVLSTTSDLPNMGYHVVSDSVVRSGHSARMIRGRVCQSESLRVGETVTPRLSPRQSAKTRAKSHPFKMAVTIVTN